MTEKETQRELARVATELERAIAQLVQAPAKADGWPAALEAAAAALARARVQGLSRENRQAFAAELQSIRQRAGQVNALIESAAQFYWGAVAVTRSQGAGYTHEGALEEFALGGRMQLEA